MNLSSFEAGCDVKELNIVQHAHEFNPGDHQFLPVMWHKPMYKPVASSVAGIKGMEAT